MPVRMVWTASPGTSLGNRSYLLNKEYPKTEKHRVEEVLEDIIVQQMEPLGVMLDKQRYRGYPQDIKGIAAEPAHGDKP